MPGKVSLASSARKINAPEPTGSVDTSLLLEELFRQFRRDGRPVEVDFRQLVNWVRLGDQLTHQVHPYPAKLLPNIAHFFVHASTIRNGGAKVLDPFCGSGTVALEASLAGCTPLVADANPLALLITKVKTSQFEPGELRDKARVIVSRVARLRKAPEVPIINPELWYAPEKKRQLEVLLRAILEVEEQLDKDFFLVCFSVVARRLSYADPAISVPVRLRTKAKFSEEVNSKIQAYLKWVEATRPVEEFARVVEVNIERVEAANNIRDDRVAAIEVGNDARALLSPNAVPEPLQSDSVPLVITSPPYGSAQKYIRATSLSLNWLGLAAPANLAHLESKSIGREHLPAYRTSDVGYDPFLDSYEPLLRRVEEQNPVRARITRAYLSDMRAALSEIARVTSKNGHVVLVVGNNQVCGQVLRNDHFVSQVLHHSGLTLELSLVDHIKSRGLMTKRNATAAVIARENVLVFRKS